MPVGFLREETASKEEATPLLAPSKVTWSERWKETLGIAYPSFLSLHLEREVPAPALGDKLLGPATGAVRQSPLAGLSARRGPPSSASAGRPG